MKTLLSEIIETAAKKKTKKARAEYLREHDSVELRRILHACFHPDVHFALPEEAPPYKPATDKIGHEILYYETKKFYHFIEGGNPDLSRMRRETMFIQMLEAIHPKDAEMLVAMLGKKMPFPGVDNEVAHMAFPDLIPLEKTKEGKNVKNS